MMYKSTQVHKSALRNVLSRSQPRWICLQAALYARSSSPHQRKGEAPKEVRGRSKPSQAIRGSTSARTHAQRMPSLVGAHNPAHTQVAPPAHALVCCPHRPVFPSDFTHARVRSGSPGATQVLKVKEGWRMNPRMILWDYPSYSLPGPSLCPPCKAILGQMGEENGARLVGDQKHFGRECPLDGSGCPPPPHQPSAEGPPIPHQSRPEDHPG